MAKAKKEFDRAVLSDSLKTQIQATMQKLADYPDNLLMRCVYMALYGQSLLQKSVYVTEEEATFLGNNFIACVVLPDDRKTGVTKKHSHVVTSFLEPWENIFVQMGNELGEMKLSDLPRPQP